MDLNRNKFGSLQMIAFAAFATIFIFASGEPVPVDRLISAQKGRSSVGHSINTFSYTAIGWNHTEIEPSILEENVEYIASAPRPNNASAYETIILLPEHAFVTTEVLNNRTLAVSLSQRVPEPDPLFNPCINDSESPDDIVVTRMSCWAREIFSYYVVNILEKVVCDGESDCREDGLKIFSTTVVFDRDGRIIAKYRKYNLIDEPALDAAPEQEFVTFTTEHNVTIGLLTGYDLLFKEPSQTLLSRGIKNFMYSYAWKNKMPFQIATSTQHGWVELNDLSLATSNYMRSQLGYTGNGYFRDGYNSIGIQRGSGGYIYEVHTYSPIIRNELTSKTKNYVESKLVGDIYMESQDLTGWSSVPVPQSNNEINNVEVCHGDEFCCTLTYRTIRSAENSFYQLIAYDGNTTDSQGRILYPEQTCGLVACSGPDVSTCGANKFDVSYTNDISFAVLKLSGQFSTAKVIPISMAGDEYFFPLGTLNLTSTQDGDRYNVTWEYNKSSFVLVHSFALSSTDYPAKSGAKEIVMTPLILFIAIMWKNMF